MNHLLLRLIASVVLLCCCCLTQVQAFSVPEKPSAAAASTTVTSTDGTVLSTRRDVFSKATAAVLALNTLSFAVPTLPANAVSGSKNVNAKLRGFGLPTIDKVPDGFTPLLDIYGKGKNRFPILVTFNHPLSWVVTLPSNDVNGEDGTIQAGEYAKGDTATLYVYTDASGSISKETVETVLKKAIGQRGDNMYQNFKVTKTEQVGDYVLADFKYQLLTGAGFEVDRKGVASLTSQGAAVEALWAASTAARYKKTEPQLRDIVASFRCYSEGINFANDLITFQDL